MANEQRGRKTSTPETEAVLESIRVAFNAFNSGDMAAFQATWGEDVVASIYEAPPLVWAGKDVVARWLDDSAGDPNGEGSDRRIELKRCLKARIEDDRAFLVLVVTVSVLLDGQCVEEDGIQISTLTRGAKGWKVAALAYGSGLDRRIVARNDRRTLAH